MRLMRSLGMTSKFTGEVVSFLFTKEEVVTMIEWLIEYQDSTEEEIMQVLGMIRRNSM